MDEIIRHEKGVTKMSVTSLKEERREKSPEPTAPPAHADEETDCLSTLMDRRKLIKHLVKIGAGGFAAAIGGGLALQTIAAGKAFGAQAPSTGTSVRWGMIVDLRRCVGCKACTVACKVENHTPPGVAYSVVMEKEIGRYPDVRREFMFRPCMQCANSSCAKVCPTGATYHREDGIVAVDYDKCIGCRYCIAACPYGSRSFDYGENYHEEFTPFEQTASPEYGENRLRRNGASPVGNVRKCTFCLHRLKKGLSPACAETCMGRAIHFGNLADPEGRCLVHGEKLHELLATRSHMRLKEELGNAPAVYYLT